MQRIKSNDQTCWRRADRENENETRRSEWLAGPTKKGIAANSPCWLVRTCMLVNCGYVRKSNKKQCPKKTAQWHCATKMRTAYGWILISIRVPVLVSLISFHFVSFSPSLSRAYWKKAHTHSVHNEKCWELFANQLRSK